MRAPVWHLHDSLPSTQDEARRLAADGAPEGTVVRAARQTRGRGRAGRAWQDPPGNLALSVLLRPGRPAGEAAHVGFVAGVALCHALDSLLPGDAPEPRAKWPNDVLLDEKKVAGVLLEGGRDHIILGIGVNVAAAPPDLPATALAAHGATAGPGTVAETLLGRLAPWYDRWRREGLAGVRAAWLARAHGLGGPVRAIVDGTARTGTFAGLDADGALLLDADGRRLRVLAGDVFFAT